MTRSEGLSPGYRMMRLMCFSVVAIALGLAVPAPIAAQSDHDTAVREVVDRLFSGMRSGDSTEVRSTFHPEARILTTALRDGAPLLQVGSVDEFVRAVGTPHEEVWDERIGEVEVRVDDPLATAWMSYRFHLGGTLSHCGVNAFQFTRTAQGWKIIQITDTRRPDCPA